MSGRLARRAKLWKDDIFRCHRRKTGRKQSQRARDRRWGRAVRKTLRDIPPETWQKYRRKRVVQSMQYLRAGEQ